MPNFHDHCTNVKLTGPIFRADKKTAVFNITDVITVL